MDEIILTSDKITEITGDDNSFPVFIKMFQYNDKWQHGIDNNGENDHSGDFNRNGSLGENFLEYSIDCRHESINLEDETEAFKNIINKLLHTKNPTFLKSNLLEKFYMFQIPDYGAQSMSAYYRDFVVHIYIKETTKDGKEIKKKIWQKYIGIIKRFTQKIAYILIDRTAFTNEDIIYDFNNIEMHVIPKNGIENGPIPKMDKLDLSINEDKSIINIKKESDSTFASGNKTDFIKVISDNTNYLMILPNYFINYNETNLNNNIIASQTIQIKNGKNTISYDYFKQKFNYDYQKPKDPEIYERPDAKKVINFIGCNNLRIPKSGSAIQTNIYTRQNMSDAYYYKNLNNLVEGIFKVIPIETKEVDKHFSPKFLLEYIKIYNKLGEEIIIDEEFLNTIINNYISIVDKNDNSKIIDYEVIINYSDIYDYEKNNQKSIKKINLKKSNNKMNMISYDNFIPTNFNRFFHTVGKNPENIGTEVIIDAGFIYDNFVVFSNPIEYLNYLEKIDFYMIDRCFLIKLKRVKINSICSIYKLPDAFKNEDAMRSIEKKIYIRLRDPSDGEKLNINGLYITSILNLVFNGNSEINNNLGNIKIINFKDKNKNSKDIQEQSLTEDINLNYDPFMK